ncbi:MAG: hypothetical protein J7J92_00925 [Candidatus Aenigmarchaeota archaeon]|nr:hypothetical protein [Candidatus Aenigmarchaeota archaeon]
MVINIGKKSEDKRIIEDLETKILTSSGIPNLKNELTIVRDGKKIVYVGKAENLQFHIHIGFTGLSILGQAKLEKYNVNEKNLLGLKKKKKVWSFKTPTYLTFISLQTLGQHRGNLVRKELTVNSSQYDQMMIETRYYEEGGELKTLQIGGYKQELAQVALNEKGIILDPNLLDSVFEPIDRKLMETYKKVYEKIYGMKI